MKPVFFFLLLFPIVTGAQTRLQDDFSDGNLTQSPAWVGDLERFQIRNGVLFLADTAPQNNNESVLTLDAATDPGAVTAWECHVRLDFAPSTTNYARIFLGADRPDLRSAQPAYYVQVGGISGDGDALILFRHDGSRADTLIAGRTGGVGPSPAQARIRVVSRPGGRWELWADYQGGTDFQLEGAADAPPSAPPPGRYFGLYCRYTSTRAQSFSFDDILIDPVIPDTAAPLLLSAIPVDANTLQLRFNEVLAQVAASNPDTYRLDGGIGAPATARISDQDPLLVTLTLATPLQNLQTYVLTATGLSDPAGNRADTLRATFTYLEPRPAGAGDLLITEIMADPSPVQSVLPEAEYIELYNAGENVIDLGELTLSIGNSVRSLPGYLLLPGRYVTLADAGDAGALAAFGPVAPVTGFPGLTNGGATLQLRNAVGDVLVSLTYRLDWYRDPDKAEGGWSLELISLAAPNDCPQNWTAGLDARGGTPGQPNSTAGLFLETDPPALLRATPVSGEELLLVFNEPLDREAAGDAVRYTIDRGVGVLGAFPQDPDAQQVLLLLDRPLQTGVIYRIAVGPPLPDCLGNQNETAGQEARFGLAEVPAPGDLVINELLFYPQSGGQDFVELFNTSDKIIDLNGLVLRNARKTGGRTSVQVTTPYLVFPGDYVVLTPDPADLVSRYRVERSAALLALDLPTLDSDAGNLTISAAGITLDSFDYSEGLHNALLDNPRGVSLERIDPEAGTQNPGNWSSAAATVGYATPTYRNSQFLTLTSPVDDIFQLAGKRFSPDGDGFEDVLLISYQTDRPGYLLNLRVFDAQGRFIRTLANNELLPTQGIIQWDGATEESERARLGIYILWFELYTPDGAVSRDKKTCVLAGYLGE